MDSDKIYLGDAYELIKQIPDKSVDLIVTDPPYDISILHGGPMVRQKRFQTLYTSLNENDLDRGFDLSILDEFMRVMKKPNIYIWCSKAQIRPLLDYFLDKGCKFDIITWHKTNAMPLCGGKYLVDTEYCLYFRDGVKLNTRYETAMTHYELTINQADKDSYGHPTIKPLEIIKNFIINSSDEGSLVLDPFIGSGTTAVASKELKRHWIGFEINPEYHKIANNRINGIDQHGQMSLLDTNFEQIDLFGFNAKRGDGK